MTTRIAATPAPAYTSDMGEAAEEYLSSFALAHPLPANWRWEECFNIMMAAAKSGGAEGAIK